MLFSVAEKVSLKRDYNASATTHDFILMPTSQEHNVFRSSLWNYNYHEQHFKG